MKKHLVNVSPWILAAACGLLVVIIGSFALSNYHREKRLMELALLQKGEAVLRVIDSGMKVSLRGHIMELEKNRYSWTEHIQEVIHQVMDDVDINFVQLVDGRGVVRAASNSADIGKRVNSGTMSFLMKGRKVKPGMGSVSRLISEKDGNETGFQVAKTYGMGMKGDQMQKNMRGRGMMERFFKGKRGDELRDELERMQDQHFFLLAELSTADYAEAVKRQLLQIIVLSVVLLLVGAGGWLSLMTLQGLKGTQTRLSRISTFNDILIESLPVGLVAIDGENRIQTVNGVAGDYLGLGEAENRGLVSYEVLPHQLNRYLGPEKNVMLPYSGEVVLESAGQNRSVLISVIGITGNEEGSELGEVLLMQDVTEIRGLEQQLQRSARLAALGKMAAGVAHELRNPLSSIKGLAVVLKSRLGNDETGVETADVLVGEVERLNRSISELLEYARPEKLDKKMVSLKGIVEKNIMLVGIDANQHGITLKTSFNENEDVILADEDKLNQVFLNILLNAVQSGQEGGTILVTVMDKAENILCTVKDEGAGITEENLARVFDPYFTTKNEGTGLGLAISAKIVEEHGGSIAIDSVVNEGTLVTVQMPKAMA